MRVLLVLVDSFGTYPIANPFRALAFSTPVPYPNIYRFCYMICLHSEEGCDLMRAFLLVGGLATALSFAASAHASPIVFTFNSLSPSAGNNSTNIANYMDGVLGCVGCVTVTGAATVKTYTGDGHVVGPGTTGTTTSLTLGNTDGATSSNSNSVLNGAYDTFISNTAFTGGSPTQISQQMIMTFSSAFALNGTLSFDYEIFPDASGTASNPPDLIFNAWNGGSLLQTKTFLGVVPGTAPIGSIRSPISSHETSPQIIGTYSTGPLTHVTELDFIDWPATIAIDNLKITPTPEPRFYGLLLAAFLGLAGIVYNKRRTAQSNG